MNRISSSKILNYSLKILFLLLLIFISSIWISSCSLIKNNDHYPITHIQNNRYISECENYKVTFGYEKGQLTDLNKNLHITFIYEYESGITLCKYEVKDDEGEIKVKTIKFVFIEENLLYSQTYNKVFINY